MVLVRPDFLNVLSIIHLPLLITLRWLPKCSILKSVGSNRHVNAVVCVCVCAGLVLRKAQIAVCHYCAFI